ncbi:MAG: NAD-dependent deacylase [Synergistaceae bacterium]|nr:NAD-dependent deacylase [Synergistaceae bacterium]
MKKLIVLTGAGMSAESGLKTFRDAGGLWENYNVEEVASIDGWHRNPELMTRFYNERRAQLEHAEPNQGHKILAELEKFFDVQIITQNVDNLHERAGSTKIIHLHGELTKVRSVNNPDKVYDIGYRAIKYGECAPEQDGGGILRPHIVWFGEAVPMISAASRLVREADIFAVIGSSLNVYPAAGLLYDLRGSTECYLIDPKDVAVPSGLNFTVIKAGASEGCEIMRDKLLNKLN